MDNRHGTWDYYENHINQTRAFSKTQLKSQLKTLSPHHRVNLLFTHATYSDLSLIKMITKKTTVNLKAIDLETGGNCIHFAAKYACYLGNLKENLKFIRFLIRQGVDINHRDKRGISGFEQHILEFFQHENNPEKWEKLNRPQILAMKKAGAILHNPKAKIPHSEKTYEEGLKYILQLGKTKKEILNNPDLAFNTHATHVSQTSTFIEIPPYKNKIDKAPHLTLTKDLTFFQTRSEGALPGLNQTIERKNSCPEKNLKVGSLRQPG